MDSGQKRTCKHILVFGEIFVQIALKDVDTEKKGKEREMKTLKQTIIGLD